MQAPLKWRALQRKKFFSRVILRGFFYMSYRQSIIYYDATILFVKIKEFRFESRTI